MTFNSQFRGILFCLLLYACAKPESDKPVDPVVNPIVRLPSFQVTVKQRVPSSAIIEWTTVPNYSNADSVKYKVFLNNRLVDSNLTRTIDTLYNLSRDSVYQGRVIAYIKRGDTSSASFVLDKYTGFVYVENRFFNKLECYSAYPNGISNQPLWDTYLPDAISRPTLSNDTLFLTRTLGSGTLIQAMNADSGKVLWSSTINYWLPNEVSPTYYDGKLITSGGTVSLLNAANGQVIWHSQNNYNDFGTNPVVDNGKIFVGNRTTAGHIAALNLTTGTVVWNFQCDGQINRRPLVANNLVIFGTSAAKVYALHQSTGAIAWTRDLSVQYNNHGANSVSPILVNGSVIVHTANEGFYALNVATGATKWIYPNDDPSVSSPVYGNGKLYFGTTVLVGSNYRSKLVALNAVGGQALWERTTGYAWLSDLVYAKDKLYARTYYDIVLFNGETGTGEGTLLRNGSAFTGYGVRINNTAYYTCEHGNYKTP